MGFWNPRAICPNCGGKIHTQAGRTGHACQHCGAALTGRRSFFTNKGQPVHQPPAEPPEPTRGERRDVVLTALPEGAQLRKVQKLVRRWTSDDLTTPMVITQDILIQHAEALRDALEKRGATAEVRASVDD